MSNQSLQLPQPAGVIDREGGRRRCDQQDLRQQCLRHHPHRGPHFLPPRLKMQDRVDFIPTVVSEAPGKEEASIPESALDQNHDPGHETTADPGGGLRGHDHDGVAVQG